MFWLLLSPALASDLLLTHARLWDGTGAPVQQDVSILVHDDRIAAIGALTVDDPAVEVRDLRGATVIPGLFDVHVHLVSNPGGHWRSDSEDERRAQVRQDMRALLACGVTTIFDPGSLPAWQREVNAWVAEGAPSPELHIAGVALSPVGGYLDGAFPGYPHVGDRAELARVLDDNDGIGAEAIKVAIESGFVGHPWPVFSQDLRDAIVDEAQHRSKPLYIHAISSDELDLALSMRPYTLVHTPDHLSGHQFQQIVALNPYVTSTYAYLDMNRYGLEPARLDDPLTRLVVPPAQLATASDPGIFRRYLAGMAEVILPHAPFLRPTAVRVMGRERFVERELSKVGGTLHRLLGAGLRVVLGSDSGNWPVFPYLFHGISTLREVDLLAEQGFSPTQVLTAATLTPARMLHLDDRLGTVEVGKEADLVVLRDDPTQDLHAVWTVEYTVANGEIRDPAGWVQGPAMARPSRPPGQAPRAQPGSP